MSRRHRAPLYSLNIVSGTEMAAVDRCSIEERGISGLFLMEKAGESVAQSLFSTYPSNQLNKTAILCGKGNNGGDGFVIACSFAKEGHHPQIALLGHSSELKGDALTNYNRAVAQGISIHECCTEEDISLFFENNRKTVIWIDALLGTGTQGAPRGLIAYAIPALNQAGKTGFIVSIDIPSGVDANTGAVPGVAVQADSVYTMGLPKIGHVLPPGLDHYRDLTILDIGFPADLLTAAKSQAELLTDAQIDGMVPRRTQSAHKGSEGHLLIIAGSRGMTGAALLCSKAAITTGAGLVTTVCPASLLPIYANGVWEMLTKPVEETSAGSISVSAFDTIFDGKTRYAAVVIGPGLSRDPSSMDLVRRIASEIDLPVVFDGDALFALSPSFLAQRKAPWIATPHPGEMARLFETTVSTIQADRWNYAKQLASSTGIAVLKGPKTVIASVETPLWINPTGCPEMASGGMGDVLAGMTGALLAKGLPPKEAAAAGAFLHGRAAELSVQKTKAEALSASTVIDWIQRAVCSVRN